MAKNNQKPSFLDEIINNSKEEKEDKKPTKERTLSEIIKSHLTEEQIKQNLGNISEETEERVEEILTLKNKQKLKEYDKLKTELKKTLERLSLLETKQADYNKIRKELEQWTNTFSEKPKEIYEKIKNLENGTQIIKTDYNQLEDELDKWESNFENRTPEEVKQKINELEYENTLINQTLKNEQKQKGNLSKEINELKNKVKEQNKNYEETQKELNKWIETWGNKNPQELKKEWELLKKRPEIPISEKQWWDDYVQRKSLTESKKVEEELKEYKQELKNLLELSELSHWKTELTKLKRGNEGITTRIKLILGLGEEEDLPDDWHNQIITKQSINYLESQIKNQEGKLQEWKYYFPKKTPEQLDQEVRELKKPQKLLQEWNDKFPNKTVKEVGKEISNKETEILILKQQIADLGGTVGANTSEKLIESKLKEVIGVEEWNIGYLLQILRKFQEWRDNGTSEQKRAIAKYWLVIKRNIEYLEEREKKVSEKYI